MQLPGGKSGMVHISEIANSYVDDISKFLKDGQQVQVKLIGIDQANRINLSIKKALPQEERPQQQDRPQRAPRPYRPALPVLSSVPSVPPQASLRLLQPPPYL